MSESSQETTRKQLAELRTLLDQYFNLEEIETLAFDLNVNHEQLKGNTLSRKVLSLIEHLDNRHRLIDLISKCRELRPGVKFPDLTSSVADPLDKLPEIIQIPAEVQHDTNWAGYLLDYGSRYFGDRMIEYVCANCVETFDLQPLLDALAHSEKNVCKFATKALGEIGSRFAVDKVPIVRGLIEAINSTNQDLEIRRKAVWALGAVRPLDSETREDARRELRKLLINRTEDTSIRWKAAWALGELQAKQEASILAHFAGNPDTDISIRRAAIRSLGVLKATKHRAVIANLADHNGSKLERTAAWSLAEIDSSKKALRQKTTAPPAESL